MLVGKNFYCHYAPMRGILQFSAFLRAAVPSQPHAVILGHILPGSKQTLPDRQKERDGKMKDTKSSSVPCLIISQVKGILMPTFSQNPLTKHEFRAII